MPKKRKIHIKEKILRTAAKLFSERGCNEVTTRDLAAAVGIRAASVYYHFPVKGDIPRVLYKCYSDERIKATPDLGELLKLADSAPLNEVLLKAEIIYNEDIREFLDQILVIALRNIGIDHEAERFIQENIFDATRNILKPVLERMVELGKIKLVDIDTFIDVQLSFKLGTVALSRASNESIRSRYRAGLPYVYSILRN